MEAQRVGDIGIHGAEGVRFYTSLKTVAQRCPSLDAGAERHRQQLGHPDDEVSLRRLARVAFCAPALAAVPVAARAPAPVVVYASQPGLPTLDEGDGGGNPFATAVVDLLNRPGVTMAALPPLIRAATRARSDGFQEVDIPDVVAPGDAPLASPGRGERRVALVIVEAAYASGHFPSLAGAARDGRRVGDALARAGYAVAYVVDADRGTLDVSLGDFARRAAAADVALIYATGHGVQRADRVYLRVDPGAGVPAPNRKGNTVAIREIADAADARHLNLMFWAGCRTAM